MHIYTFLLRMTNTTASQNIDLSSWDILYRQATRRVIMRPKERGGYEDRSLIQANGKAGSKWPF
jgi:regulator of sirC expression with transglutaminase-like and TPR domain